MNIRKVTSSRVLAGAFANARSCTASAQQRKCTSVVGGLDAAVFREESASERWSETWGVGSSCFQFVFVFVLFFFFFMRLMRGRIDHHHPFHPFISL